MFHLKEAVQEITGQEVFLQLNTLINKNSSGYSMAEKVHEELVEMIDREAEGSDSLEV